MEDLPGFRFYPTEEELVSFYLHNKLDARGAELNQLIDRVIPELDIYEFNPWDLPEFSGQLCHGDPEQWFFFIPRPESEARGGRPKRLTTSGYWKATGTPGYVYSSANRTVGVKRTMVYYTGRAPSGSKTEWKMNEYKAIIEGEASSSGAIPRLRQEYSLCRVYKQSKSLRAFDRRPTATSATHPPALLLHDTSTTVEAAAGSSRSLLEKPQEISETTMGSPDNSPSSHDAIVGALHGSHSAELATGDEDDGTLMMDLDQLSSWFYGNSSQNTEEDK